MSRAKLLPSGQWPLSKGSRDEARDPWSLFQGSDSVKKVNDFGGAHTYARQVMSQAHTSFVGCMSMRGADVAEG